MPDKNARAALCFCAALILALTLPAHWTLLLSGAALCVIAYKKKWKAMRFIVYMMTPLAFGMWLVHGGAFASLLGRHQPPNWGAAAVWFRILAVVSAGQAWLAVSPPRSVIESLFASSFPVRAAYLTASPLLVTEQIRSRLEQIEEAQAARGVNVHGRVTERCRALAATLIPLILGLLSDIPARSTALDMKALGLAKRRTSLKGRDSDAPAEIEETGAALPLEVKDLMLKTEGSGAALLSVPEFAAAPGECVMVAGASGSGKSIFSMFISGAVPEHLNIGWSGGANILGRQVSEMDMLHWSPYIQYVQQAAQLSLSGCAFNVHDECAFGAENTGLPSREIRSRLERGIAAAGISDLLEKDPAHLSGGEAQKTSAASAVTMTPKLLVMDEAFGKIHSSDVPKIMENIKALQRENGMAVILLEQDERRMGAYCDKFYHIKDGRLLKGPADGPLVIEAPAYGAAHSDMPALVLKDVSFAWSAEREPLFAGLSLTVHHGERAVLTGPNGAGKSTLMRIASGLLRPKPGCVTLDGADVFSMPSKVRAQKIAFLFQDAERQIFHSNVYDETAFVLRRAGLSEEEVMLRVEPALKEFGLWESREAHPLDLCSSLRRMTALASAAIVRPELLLLDEPTRDLDAERRAIFEKWLARQECAVLAVSHDEAFAQRAFHTRWLLQNGNLTRLGDKTEASE